MKLAPSGSNHHRGPPSTPRKHETCCLAATHKLTAEAGRLVPRRAAKQRIPKGFGEGIPVVILGRALQKILDVPGRQPSRVRPHVGMACRGPRDLGVFLPGHAEVVQARVQAHVGH